MLISMVNLSLFLEFGFRYLFYWQCVCQAVQSAQTLNDWLGNTNYLHLVPSMHGAVISKAMHAMEQSAQVRTA